MKEIDIGTGYCNSVVEFSPHTLFSDFDHKIFNSFIAFYRLLSIPQYVLNNTNCEPEDNLNSQNMFYK
jgi:hypothetical protein